MLIDYLPHFMGETRELAALMYAENPETDNIISEGDKLLDTMFIMSADENGIAVYENMLGIRASLNDSLDTRRLRVLTRFNKILPYTEISVFKQLIRLCGENGFDFEVEYNEYIVKLALALKNKGLYREISTMLRGIIPANMGIVVSLKYNRHIDFFNNSATHAFLAENTHFGLREEVIF